MDDDNQIHVPPSFMAVYTNARGRLTERADAVRIAREIGARHELVESQEIHNPSYAKNPENRCFHCKSELYAITARRATELGLRHVINGTNVDDLGDYRPGLQAAEQAAVRSPLVEAGLTKAEVREAARGLGLDFWDKPAAACLSSRIPYGTEVTPERLRQVERLEDALHALRVVGFQPRRGFGIDLAQFFMHRGPAFLVGHGLDDQADRRVGFRQVVEAFDQ